MTGNGQPGPLRVVIDEVVVLDVAGRWLGCGGDESIHDIFDVGEWDVPVGRAEDEVCAPGAEGCETGGRRLRGTVHNSGAEDRDAWTRLPRAGDDGLFGENF